MKRGVCVVLAVALVVLAGCSSSDENGGAVGGGGSVVADVADDGDVFAPVDDLGPVPPPLPDETAVSDAVLEPIEPVPDTGVPGIDSDDVFCRSWSEFAGSYQALTFAWAVQDPIAAARLEVVATDTLSSAVARLGVSLPAELEAERQALTVDLPTPLLRRAERARELLVESGLDDAAIEDLGQRWLDAVTAVGLESETLGLPIDAPDLDASVQRAAEGLTDALPPIVEDPSLIVDVDISVTEQYLFENCPDRGILAGADNVDL